MTKYGTPSIFTPENFFTKMTQNGLNWILNTTFGNVTHLFFEQIEKFQCLKVSTTQGLAPGTLRLHLATCHVPENVPQSY